MLVSIQAGSRPLVDVYIPGPQGPKGDRGTTWLSGAGVPATGLGLVQDWYLNTLNGDVYEKTGLTTWTLRDNLTGPAATNDAQTWVKAHRWEPDSNVVPITIKANVSQTVDLTQWLNNSGLRRWSFSASGENLTGFLSDGASPSIQFKGGGDTASPRVYINTHTATVIGQVIKGGNSQTSDLSQWQNSNNTVLASVGADGRGIFAGITTTPATASNSGIAVFGNTNQAGPLMYVRPGTGQTANLTEWHDSSGAVTARVGVGGGFSTGTNNAPALGQLRLGSNVPSLYFDLNGAQTWLLYQPNGAQMYFRDLVNSKMHITMQPGGAGLSRTEFADSIVVLGAASQSTDMTQWKNSAGTVIASVRSTGHFAGNGFTGGSSTLLGYGDSTLELYEPGFAPRLGFHWGGTVASQISIESSGTIAIRDNPGTGYQAFKASRIDATTGLYDAGNRVYSASNPPSATDLTNYVTTGTDQTISGVKTFSAQSIYNANILINASGNDGNRYILTWASDPNWRIGMGSPNAGVVSVGAGFIRKYATSHVQYITYGAGTNQGYAVGPNGTNTLSHLEVRGSDGHTFIRNNLEVGGGNPGPSLIVSQAASQSTPLTEWKSSAGTVIASVTAAGAVGFTGTISGNGKVVADTGDNFLRINQSSQFSSGIWMGTSALRGGTGGIYLGSSGGEGNIALVPGVADSTRRITLAGNTGDITITGKLNAAAGVVTAQGFDSTFSQSSSTALSDTYPTGLAVQATVPGGGWPDDYATLLNMRQNTNRHAQILVTKFSNAMYFRSDGDGTGSTFSAWKQVAALQGAQTFANTITFSLAPVVPDGSFAISKISATGTAGATTYLRGDGAWATAVASVAGKTGAVTLVPADVGATTTNTANAIAQRDSAGDIYARLFRSEYNITTSATSANHFMVQHAVGAGADNYLRPITAASVKTRMVTEGLVDTSTAQTITAQKIFDTPAGTVDLIVRAAPSQTVDLQQWLNSANGLLARVDQSGNLITTGRVLAGTSSTPGQVASTATAATQIPFVARGAASQTANLTEWQDTAGNILARVAADGTLYIGTFAYTGSGSIAANAVTTDTVQTITASKTFSATTTQSAGTLDFGSRLGQLINLYGTAYGIGVQSGTFYSRGNNFAWYNNGIHSNTQGDPGTGGTTLATLSNSGVFNASQIHDNGTRVYSVNNAPPYPVTSVNARTGAVTGLAEANAVVNLTTAQTIAGIKTFSSAPVVPDLSFAVAKLSATGTRDATTFLRGDNTWATLNISNMVTTDTTQTITGAKTFTSPIYAHGDIDLGNSTSDGNRAIHTWLATDQNWRIGMGSSNSGTYAVGAGFVRKYLTTHVQYITYNNNTATQGLAFGPSGTNHVTGSQLSHLEIRGTDGHTFIRNNAEIGGGVPGPSLVVSQAAAQTEDLTQWKDSAGNVLARIANDGTIYKGATVVGGNASDTEIMAIMGGF